MLNLVSHSVFNFSTAIVIRFLLETEKKAYSVNV